MIRLDYFNDESASGYCEFNEGIIYINLNKNKNRSEYYSTLFHELGHIHCYKNNIWKKYHIVKKRISDLTKEEKLGLIRTGLKAEVWVDKWAEKEMKKYYPNLKYHQSYRTTSSKKWLHKNYLSKFK